VSVWLRLDADLDQHPDIIIAGPYALDVFVAVLRMAKQYGEAGTVAGKYVSPAYLARRMLWPADRAEDIATAVEGLISTGLLVENGGRLTVPGWRRYQQDRTAADRAKRYRDRKRHSSSRDVTPVTTDSTGHDETRRDMTRQNKTQAPSQSERVNGAENSPQASPGRLVDILARLFVAAGCSAEQVGRDALVALSAAHPDPTVLLEVLGGLAARGVAKGKRSPFRYLLRAIDTALAERSVRPERGGAEYEFGGDRVTVPASAMASIREQAGGGLALMRGVVRYGEHSGQINRARADELGRLFVPL